MLEVLARYQADWLCRVRLIMGVFPESYVKINQWELIRDVLCSAIYCIVVKCRDIQYCAVQCSVVQYDTLQYSTVRYMTMQ